MSSISVCRNVGVSRGICSAAGQKCAAAAVRFERKPAGKLHGDPAVSEAMAVAALPPVVSGVVVVDPGVGVVTAVAAVSPVVALLGICGP